MVIALAKEPSLPLFAISDRYQRSCREILYDTQVQLTRGVKKHSRGNIRYSVFAAQLVYTYYICGSARFYRGSVKA